jgi:pimeloyl-ACP methyl ester carboxylesterase
MSDQTSDPSSSPSSDEDKGIDVTRRSLLATGAAAAAVAATPRAFAQQSSRQGESGMPFYENGDVRIHYEDTGTGFPLLLIAGGGLNSVLANIVGNSPFNAIEEFGSEFRCISADLRNASGGHSTGPLAIDRPWDSYTDDHIGLMDHLGIDQFMVMGFCIAGPFIWNLIERAPERVAAAVIAQPVGFDPANPDYFYQGNMSRWGAELVARRPDITTAMVEAFLDAMWRTDPDFVFTVDRDFVRACETPILVLPDDSPPHPYAPAVESAMLAPNAQLSLFPWKDPVERIPLAVRHIRSFMRANLPEPGA